MSEAVPSSSCVHSDTFTEADLLARPDSIVLVNSPPDYVTSSVQQQGGHDTNSDSGDSLFITQKCAPQRRRRSNHRSNFRTHRDTPEDEYDASTSGEEHEADRNQRKKSYRTPKFTFTFLKERMMTRLPYYQNRKLHYYAMGGYFKCAEQLWDSYQTGEGLMASLPTVDVDGEPISPMSEEEDETAEDEDIRVVEKKLLVMSKAKSSQAWYNPKKRSNEETQQNEEHNKAAYGSQREQGKTTRKISTWTPLSKGTSSSETKESSEVSGETESDDEHVTKGGNLPAKAETEKTNRSPGKGSGARGFIPEENGKRLGNDSDATCSGGSAEQCDREATDAHTRVDKQTCLGDGSDIECNRIKVKKGKKKKKMDRGGDKCIEEGKEQSLEGGEGQQADPSVSLIITEAEEAPCMEKKKKKKKKKKKRENEDLRQQADGLSDERKEEDSVVVCETGIGGKKRRKKEGNVDTDSLKTTKAAESTTNDGHVPKKKKKKKKGFSDLHHTPTDHPEAIAHSDNGESFRETLESSGFKRKKQKKKKNWSPSNDNQNDVDLSNDATTVPENTDFVVKKKRKKNASALVGLPEEDDSVEKTQKDKHDVELETRMKKKKKKKKTKDDISINNSEDMLASGDYSELVHKKKKKRTPSFLSADDEEQSASIHEGRAEKPEVSTGDVAAESADVSEHLRESKGGKKQKKRSAAVSDSEEREPEETSEAVVKKKKKHKRTESLTGSLESVAHVGRSPTEEVVVVKMKKNRGTQEERAGSEKSAPSACRSRSAQQKLLTEQGGSAETSCDGSLSAEQQATETLTEGASDSHASGDAKERTKKKSADKNVADGKSCTDTVDNSTSSKTFLAELKTTSSVCMNGKRGVNAKRKLHNPDKDFLSGLNF
ncbi:uncharacterized protein FYW61_011983 [Anableps anableps]